MHPQLVVFRISFLQGFLAFLLGIAGARYEIIAAFGPVPYRELRWLWSAPGPELMSDRLPEFTSDRMLERLLD